MCLKDLRVLLGNDALTAISFIACSENRSEKKNLPGKFCFLSNRK